MICCEICNAAGDTCKETGSKIDWAVIGITLMPDCPLRERSDYKHEESDDQHKGRGSAPSE